MRALLLLLLTGCAHVSFTEPRPDDIQCGHTPTGSVAVVIRHGAAYSCAEAWGDMLAAWPNEEPDFRWRWRFLFTGGFAGFDVGPDLHGYTPHGATYLGERTVVVEALAGTEVLRHELGHVRDFEAGLPNRRDR